MMNCRRGDVVFGTVAMIMSNMARAEHRSRVIVLATSEDAKRSGLLMDSVVMADNLATVHYSEIDRVNREFPWNDGP
jgi:hypothetical protein